MSPTKTKALRQQSSCQITQQVNIEPGTAICQGCGMEFQLKACSHRLCLMCWRWQRVGKNIRRVLSLIGGT